VRSDTLEKALSTALRTLEESAALGRRLAEPAWSRQTIIAAADEEIGERSAPRS
jgi:hypothetical protein